MINISKLAESGTDKEVLEYALRTVASKWLSLAEKQPHYLPLYDRLTKIIREVAKHEC